jgi:flagellar hook-associated protein 1 FlgK
MGARSLNAQRLAIEVTGHNISNVNTPGAARQRANLVTDLQLNLSLGPQGTGSTVLNIESLRSKYLDTQIVKQTFNQGFYDKKASLAKLVQDTLGENLSTDTTGGVNGASSETGVQNDINQFFEAWQSLSSDPTSIEYRQQVLERARSLAGDIRAIATRLNDVQTDLASEASSLATDANTLAKEIASLNSQIMKVESQTGGVANDLRDKRQKAIEDLSNLVSITTSASLVNDKMIDVKIANTTGSAINSGVYTSGTISSGASLGYLVLADNANGTDINGAVSTATGSFGTTITKDSNGIVTSPVSMTLTNFASSLNNIGGEIGAVVNVANSTIGTLAASGPVDTVLEKLNLFASTLITRVNTIHASGFTNVSPYTNSGGAFFSGSDASDIGINITDANLIAASNTSGSPLDSGNATDMARLRDTQLTIGTDNVSISEYYRSRVVTDTGFVVQQAERDSASQTLVMNQLSAQRESISGISIDEEMTNLIRFQRAYEASARLVSIADEMYNRVVNGMGAGK